MAAGCAVPLLTYDDLDFIPQERAGDRHDGGSPRVVRQGVGRDPISRTAAPTRLEPRPCPICAASLAGDLGESFFVPIDVVFAPNVVAVPDVVFVARERLQIVGPKAINGVPELIVEILSPSTRRRDLGSKKALYGRFGVPGYWTVDLRRQVLTTRVLADGRYRCPDLAAGAARSEAVPGLEVDVAALFAGL